MPERFIRRRLLSLVLALAMTSIVTACGPKMTLISEGQEAAIGKQQHGKIVKEYGGRLQSAALQAYVDGIMKRVAKASNRPDIPYQIFILDTPIINAFALPGGYTYVTRGLLALANDEAELAGVIGHEIGHVTARHSAQRYTAAVGANIVANILGAVARAQAPGTEDVVGKAAQLGGSALLAGYSRGQEYEADDIGVRSSAKAGYEPEAAARFLASLGRESAFQATRANRKASPLADWFSTHPNTDERVQRARQIALPYRLDGNSFRKGRDAHLQAIANLAYGDPADGRRVKVVTVKKGETASTLAARMAVSDRHLERFMILNGLYPGDNLVAGTMVKLIQ
jgi:predicted Zn-dependent protease